jgi:Uma2 family endonuclease
MTVDEFLDWVSTQDEGRYELLDGTIIAMAPAERADHARGKLGAGLAFRTAIAQRKVPCEAFVDGPAVRIDEHTTFVPDVVIDCGERLPDDRMTVSNPIIVVEVLSPSTQYIDKSQKLIDYFRVSSLIHYLIVDVVKKAIIHHRRKDGTSIETTLIRNGQITLYPPGIVVEAEDLLG